MVAVDILIPNFADLGAQRVAINAANGLQQRGYAVRFVVMQAQGPFREYLDPAIPVLDLGEHVWNVPKVRIALWPWAYRRLLRQGPRRTLVSFSPMTNVLALVASWGIDTVSTVIQEHAFQSVALKDRSAHSPLFEYVYRTFFIPLYRRADVFLTISEAIRRDFIETFGLEAMRTRVIVNPLDITGICAKAERDIDFPMRKGMRYLIGVGRLTAQKNFPRMLRIFARIRQSEPDVELLILGAGTDLANLQAYAGELGVADAVHFLGFQSNPYSYLARADVFLLSSDWEGLPQVIAEAMVCGAPVVAHACPSGPDEMIQDKVTGRLVAFGDEGAFADAVQDCLRDKVQCARMVAQARQWAYARYGLASFLDSYEAMFRQLMTKA